MKHMAHCIRLLKTGNEILLTGKIHVDRTNIDKEYLMAIRGANIPYEEVLTESEKLFSQLDESYNISTLPHGIDGNKVDELAINLVEAGLYSVHNYFA